MIFTGGSLYPNPIMSLFSEQSGLDHFLYTNEASVTEEIVTSQNVILFFPSLFRHPAHHMDAKERQYSHGY